ncbi:group II truncated hemoglobin [Fulvimonas yonginensis]|uniref:Group II truncated hemoglobin n=1 Tax=Fulvimonas yonginensis TaxID=1495200 RepID=A0ABU8JCD0_9GAMM
MSRPAAVPSLYDWAGGMPVFERLTSVFYRRVARDADLGPLFARMDPDHPRHVAHFIAEVLGGPKEYSRERGGHRAMVGRHVGRHLDERLRRRWMALLLDCAGEADLPDDPEFRSAFVAYLEWGTRLAVINSQEGAPPPADAPMPAWGWGETGGPYTGT